MSKKRKSATEMAAINKALSGMKSGEMKHVRVGPGREGKVTIKKGKGGPVGPPKLVPPPPPRKRRAKAIRSIGY